MKTKSLDVEHRVPGAHSVGCRCRRGHGPPSIDCCAVIALGLILFGTLLPVRADLTAPDNVVYGVVVMGTNQITAADTDFVVEARRTNGLLVARYRMGQQPQVGNHYLLAIKVEEFAPRRDVSSVLNGEVLTIAALSNSIVQAQQSFAVTERGQVERLDFGSVPPGGLGFELWALAQGLDANSQALDSDEDGISNWNEYQAGTVATNAASYFRLRIARVSSTNRIFFEALRAEGIGYTGNTRHYALERRSPLVTGNWQVVPGYSDVIGDNQMVVFEATEDVGSSFFRGKVWLANAVPPVEEFRLLTGYDAGQMTISFMASGPDEQGNNRYYTLERTTHLLPVSWIAVPGYSNILGAGQTISLSVPLASSASGFYRGHLVLRSP